MSRFLSALALAFAVALGASPAPAQRIIVPTVSGGAPTNPSFPATESQGANATTGALTSITAGNAVYGTDTTLGGATANEWCGFWVEYGPATAASTRYLLRLTWDNGSTYQLNHIYIAPGATTQGDRMFFPLRVPAGSTAKVGMQASASSSTLAVGLTGRLCDGNSPPLFTTATIISTLDVANTRPSGTSTLTDGAAWTTITASTAAAYGAFMMIVGDTGTGAVAEFKAVAIASGPSDTEFFRIHFRGNSATPIMPRVHTMIQHSEAAGVKIAVKGFSTAGTENIRVQVIGFN